MTVAKHYGRVSETPCFPGEKSQEKSPQIANYYGDRELIHRSIPREASTLIFKIRSCTGRTDL